MPAGLSILRPKRLSKPIIWSTLAASLRQVATLDGGREREACPISEEAGPFTAPSSASPGILCVALTTKQGRLFFTSLLTWNSQIVRRVVAA